MAVVGTGLPLHGEGHGRGIDFDIADFHGAGRQRTLEAAKHGFDAGDQFARTEGFGDVVVGAKFETEDAVGFAALGRQENYRHRGKARSLANGAADFQTVFAGTMMSRTKSAGRWRSASARTFAPVG